MAMHGSDWQGNAMQCSAEQGGAKQRGLAIGNSRFSGSLLTLLHRSESHGYAQHGMAAQVKATRQAERFVRSF